MKISIVVTTYNGEKYLCEQLESLYRQNRKADEVIITDDCSTDNTFHLTQEFIKKYDLQKSWHCYCNENNIGVINNFWNGLRKTTGDLIFFCDQDDVWFPEKIEVMEDVFRKNQEVLALVCKENRIDKEGKSLKNSVGGSGVTRKILLCEEMKACLGAGHLLAITRNFYNRYAEKIEKDGLTFDVPFCFVASALDGFYELDNVLMNRRIHENNTSGIMKNVAYSLKQKERYIAGRKCRLGYSRFIENNLLNELSKKEQKKFQKAVQILDKSVIALNNHKLFPLIKEVLTYNPYLNKKISVANLYVYLKN